FVSAGGFVGLEGGLGAGPVSRVGAPEGVDRFGYGVAADAADGGFLRFFGEFSVAFRKNGAAGFRRIPGDLRDFLRFSSISEKIYRIKCAPARAPARARMCVRVYPISRRAEKRRKLGIIIVCSMCWTNFLRRNFRRILRFCEPPGGLISSPLPENRLP